MKRKRKLRWDRLWDGLLDRIIGPKPPVLPRARTSAQERLDAQKTALRLAHVQLRHDQARFRQQLKEELYQKRATAQPTEGVKEIRVKAHTRNGVEIAAHTRKRAG